MNEGTMANASELETPAIEQQTPEIEDDGFFSPDLEADVNEEGNEKGEGGEALIDLIEIERNGKKYSIPKDLEAELMMQADYTRKTQETSAARKEVEAEREKVRQMAAATQEELNARGMLASVDDRLGQYANVNWSRFEQEDPMGAQSEWRQYQQMKEGRAEIVAYLENAERERSEQAQQNVAKRLQETLEFAQKEIKGWTPELDAKITTFAMNDLGFDVDTLKGAYTPQVYKTLHLAFIGAETLKRQATPKPAQTQIQPLAKVTANGGVSARKSLGEMSMDEYAAHRNRQEAAARARAAR